MAGRAGPGDRPPRRGGDEAAPEPRPSSPERCAECGSAVLTRLPMVLTDGTDVTFVSCQSCEGRQWLQARADGGWDSLPIDSVLERSARRR